MATNTTTVTIEGTSISELIKNTSDAINHALDYMGEPGADFSEEEKRPVYDRPPKLKQLVALLEEMKDFDDFSPIRLPPTLVYKDVHNVKIDAWSFVNTYICIFLVKNGYSVVL